MKVVVAYDVSDNLARARLAAFLSHVGVRLQRSVFECSSPAEGSLTEGIRMVLDESRDVAHVLPICEACSARRTALGQAPASMDVAYWVI